MATVPETVIEDIRLRTDIAQVIGDRLTLKRSSGGYLACCPFHREKTPSFHVNEKRQTFHCFGCGEGGDVFKFLMKHDGMTFIDAVRYLGEKCGVEVRMTADDGSAARAKRLFLINSEAAAFFRRCLLQTAEAEPARRYLESRGLTGEIAERFGIGYDPDGWGTLDDFAAKHRFTPDEMVAAGLGSLPDSDDPNARLRDRFHGRVMFPICDHTGRVVAFSARTLQKDAKAAKYVNSPETDVFKKARVLYALDKAQRAIANAAHREAIICEGQIDVIRCHACGFDRAVASEGTAFTAEHAALLHRYADSAVELFDSDGAGRKAAVRTASILLAEGIPVRIASLPEGEDPDSFLRSHSAADFQKVLDGARGVVPFHIDCLRAQETDPDGPGAAERIVQGVLQTVAACSSAVQKARMVQEAARILSLPEQVLQDELAGVEETLRRQSERAAVREAAAADRAALAADRAGGPAPERDTRTPPRNPVKAAPSALDVAVCEYLFNHYETDPGTVNMLARLMPATLFECDVARHVIEAFYAGVGSSTDPALDLQASDPEAEEFLAEISLRRDRAGDSENFLAKDVAHELVLRAWRRHLESRVAACERSPDAMSPDALRMRMETRDFIRRLKNWDTGEACVMRLAEAGG